MRSHTEPQERRMRRERVAMMKILLAINVSVIAMIYVILYFLPEIKIFLYQLAEFILL